MKHKRVWTWVFAAAGAVLVTVCLVTLLSYTISQTLTYRLNSMSQTSSVTASATQAAAKPADLVPITVGKNLKRELQVLVDNNIVCVQMFTQKKLPVDSDSSTHLKKEGYTLLPVRSASYKSLQDIADLLESTYSTLEAKTLLYGTYYTVGQPLYVEENGVLYQNDSAKAQRQDTIRWDGYEINVIYLDEGTCRFYVTALDWSYTTEEYTPQYVQMTAHKTEAGWRLDKLYTGFEEDNYKRTQAQQAYQ